MFGTQSRTTQSCTFSADAKRRALLGRAQREREWASQGRAKVRRSGETDKFIRAFKIDQTEQLAGKAAQTKRALDRLEVIEQPREPWELRLDIPDAELGQRHADPADRRQRGQLSRGRPDPCRRVVPSRRRR